MSKKKGTISFRTQPVLTTKMLAEMVIFMEKQQQGNNANGGKLSLGKFLLCWLDQDGPAPVCFASS